MAQIKYYQEQGGGAQIWSDILHPSTQTDAVDSPDNISMLSCPVNATNLTHFPLHKRTKSACLPVRPPRSARPLSHQLSSSPSSYSTTATRPATPPLYSSRFSLTASQPSLVPQSPPTPRPESLYIPFVGCVEAPRAPPGQAAREILQAMSFAPTHESFTSAQDNHTPVIPPRRSLTFRSPKLQSKSSSLVSLIGAVSPKMSKRFDSNISTSSTSLTQPLTSLYSPCHPANNSNNINHATPLAVLLHSSQSNILTALISASLHLSPIGAPMIGQTIEILPCLLQNTSAGIHAMFATDRITC